MATTASELSPLQAYNLLMAFASRYGENALRLALHAALPQVLRTDILHLLRLNFVPESMPDLAVEADVLFAPFCQDLGNGYYRFDQNVRLQLLQNLDPAYAEEPTPRSVLIARFLLSYIEQQSRSNDVTQDRLYAAYLEVERWGALGFLDPEVAAAQLAAALQQATSSNEIAVRIRVAGLAAALSTPLARYGKLLAYAAGLEAMETGKIDQAKQLLEGLGDAEIEIGKIRLKSPRRVLLERLQTLVETVAEEKDQAAEPQISKTTRNTVFICYSHRDKRWLDQLLTFLKPLERTVRLDLWDDTRIKPGSHWWEEMCRTLASAKVAVLLVSADFLASDFIAEHELPRLLEAAQQEGAFILPVILSPCRFESSGLVYFQTVNSLDQPLNRLSHIKRNEVLFRVAELIREHLDSAVDIEPTGVRDGRPIIRYFVSYAHEDQKLRDELLKRLKQLMAIAKDYYFESWDDEEILAGELWYEQLQTAVTRCQFGLLLVSPAFLGSAYTKGHEFPASVEPERPAIPVALKRIPFDGSIDLKGLERLQVFRDSSGKTFQECRTSKTRDDFASELFQQILKIVERYYGTFPPSPAPQLKPSKEVAGQNNDQDQNEAVLKDKTINQPKPARVYISSTYSDLKEHRQAVYQVLRKLNHDVIAMEDYPASDQKPLDRSYSDIAACDVFIAIIGWRYGYIPDKDNPEHLSITGLEYRQAQQYAKPCLIFLLSEEVTWPQSLMDSYTGEGDRGKRIKAFRDELMQQNLVSFFNTPDELSKQIVVAMMNWERHRDPAGKDQGRTGATTRQFESFDVFLSHNSKDKMTVRQLAHALQARGLKVWLDEEQLVPGQPWQEALETIIQTIHSVAVLVGKDGLGPWEIPEMQATLSEFMDRKLPIIPVLLPDAPAKSKLPLFLRSFTWVDLRGGLTEDGLDQLEWGITGAKSRERALPRKDPAKVSPLTKPYHLRVFLASPGDVADERCLALKVLEELQYDPLLRGRITIETVAWDKPGKGTPMLVTMTPQEAINKGLPTPAQCDIVIVIFWSRMGTPLPADWKKLDGSGYRSGAEWEYLNALEAAEKPGKPEVLVYRRTEKQILDPEDPQFEEKRQQWQLVQQFFQSFENPDGSLRRGYNPYSTPEDFREQLNLHLRTLLVRELLEREV